MKAHLWLRSACSALAGFFLLLGPVSMATAAAPQLKTSAPGYYRMMLGDFEVTALSDGTVDLKMERAADEHHRQQGFAAHLRRRT